MEAVSLGGASFILDNRLVVCSSILLTNQTLGWGRVAPHVARFVEITHDCVEIVFGTLAQIMVSFARTLGPLRRLIVQNLLKFGLDFSCASLELRVPESVVVVHLHVGNVNLLDWLLSGDNTGAMLRGYSLFLRRLFLTN